VQDLVLDVRRQQQQIHDLRHPRSANVAEPGNVSVIAELAPIDHMLELDRERHQAGYSREARYWR
jgi:hypothetical protein